MIPDSYQINIIYYFSSPLLPHSFSLLEHPSFDQKKLAKNICTYNLVNIFLREVEMSKFLQVQSQTLILLFSCLDGSPSYQVCIQFNHYVVMLMPQVMQGYSHQKSRFQLLQGKTEPLADEKNIFIYEQVMRNEAVYLSHPTCNPSSFVLRPGVSIRIDNYDGGGVCWHFYPSNICLPHKIS